MPRPSGRHRLARAACLLLSSAIPYACREAADESAPLAVAARCSLAASHVPVAADGLHAHVIDVQVRDGSDRPLADQAVVLFGDDASLRFDQPPATDANGHTSGHAYATVGGNQWVRGALLNGLGAEDRKSVV